MILSEAELEHFQREGWLVAKGVLPREVVEAVQVRCAPSHHRLLDCTIVPAGSGTLGAARFRSSVPQLRSQIVH